MCTNQIKALKENLAAWHTIIEDLSAKLKQQFPLFSEESLKNDESVVLYTNIKVLRAIFDHVVKTIHMEATCKLNTISRIYVYLIKAEIKQSNSRLQKLPF